MAILSDFIESSPLQLPILPKGGEEVRVAGALQSILINYHFFTDFFFIFPEYFSGVKTKFAAVKSSSDNFPQGQYQMFPFKVRFLFSVLTNVVV